jgi:multiple sugar transport system substrate-binding protein
VKKPCIYIGFALAGMVVAAACIWEVTRFALKKKQITLEFGMFAGSNWDVANGDSYRIIDRAIMKFERSHPGVHVHYYSGIRKRDYAEWFSEQVLQGKTPDVAMILENQFNKLASMGVLKDLDPVIKADGRVKSWEYFTTAWNSGTYHGSQYALPYEADFMLMAVNKTLLTRHNFPMPKNNWTWDDFYSLCKALTADENGDSILDIAGVCGYTWQDAVYSNGARLFDENGKQSYFSDQKVVEAVRFMQKLSALTGDKLFTQTDFDAGKVAFMPLSFAKYRTYISYPYKINKDMNYEWQCLTMPAGYSGNNISEVDTLLMGISADTRQVKLAFDLLETLTHDKEIQTDICLSSQGASAMRMIAASDTAKRILDENIEKNSDSYHIGLIADIMNKGVPVPKFRSYNEDMVLADSAVNKIISDKKDADNSLKVLQRTILAQLEK